MVPKQTSNPLLLTTSHSYYVIVTPSLATKFDGKAEIVLVAEFKVRLVGLSNILSSCEHIDLECRQDEGMVWESLETTIDVYENELFCRNENYVPNLDEILSLSVEETSSADLSEEGMKDNGTARTF